MTLLRIALASLLNRRYSAALTIAAIAVSVALLLGVEKVRTETRSSFAATISGTDLIVGARTGSIQLLLYSVFRIGEATNNISWQSYQEIAAHPQVAWTVPLSLGDSHRGFRVLGTTPEYFEHYRYGDRQLLAFAEGRRLEDIYDAVLGAQVAEELGYVLDQEITISHGIGAVSFAHHEEHPFRVVGILRRSGTPVDRTVHVTLEGIEAIHIGWETGARQPGATVDAEGARQRDLTPASVTAILVGMQSRLAIFGVQRQINEFRGEPLLAILPGVALQQLWGLVSVAENALFAVSACVVLAGLLGMLAALLTTLNERRREMAILRSTGARPLQIFGLLVFESMLLTVLGILAGLILLYAGLILGQELASARFGLYLAITPPSLWQWQLLGLVLGAGLAAGTLPAWLAYRHTVADGLTLRT
jgi:putative ABC transport system permease protein